MVCRDVELRGTHWHRFLTSPLPNLGSPCQFPRCPWHGFFVHSVLYQHFLVLPKCTPQTELVTDDLSSNLCQTNVNALQIHLAVSVSPFLSIPPPPQKSTRAEVRAHTTARYTLHTTQNTTDNTTHSTPCTHACLRTCTRTHTHTYTARARTHTHTHMHTHPHTHTQPVRAHTHPHTTHTQKCVRAQEQHREKQKQTSKQINKHTDTQTRSLCDTRKKRSPAFHAH